LARAHAGTMSMMLAGPADALQMAEPLIAALSAQHFIISNQPGDAARAKLVNNLLAAAHLVAASEAFALAEKVGLKAQQMLPLVHASSGQSWMADERLGRWLNDDLTPRAQMHVLTKDVTLSVQMAQTAGMDLRLGEQARAIMQEACDAGYRFKDDAELLNHLRRA
jgi:L-threonate 2-dehydrogenase